MEIIMKKIEVVAAVFIEEKKVFCAQRGTKGPLALKWEFPGGKIEPNETKEKALIREIKEELQTDIKVDEYLLTVEHLYESFYIIMHVYLCTVLLGDLTLTEHINKSWIRKEELDTLDWAPADLAILEKIKELL